MDEAADKIAADIDRTRERLGLNIQELERRVETATDWREQFRTRPHVFLGGAFVAGAVVAATLRRTSVQQASRPQTAHLGSASDGRVSTQAQAFELWNDIKGALMGVASTQITKYIGDLIPGFDEHYQRMTHRTAAAPRT
jgi:hypothetical protein